MLRTRVIAAAATGSACLALALTPALAASNGEYAKWGLTGQTGTVAVPATGFPSGSFTSNATGMLVPTGASTYLSTSTPFGAEFGSSKDHEYLKFGAASGGRPSTTTVTFNAATTPGDWGFALGDIDADHVRIIALGADGTPLTADQLGWQSAFNYCEDTPRPPVCRSLAHTDKPRWDAATSTLIGNGTDTTGGSGWFKPTVPVKSLSLVFTVQTGIPVGQLWIAAKWTSAKPDISITKTASPAKVRPGGKVTYTVKVTNSGTAPEDHAEFTDDLGDVVDDARYNGDATADAGIVTYTAPKLNWEGPVAPGQTRTVSYSVTVGNPPKGNREILNAIIGDGPRMTCQGGVGPGCAVPVIIDVPPRKGHHHHHHHHHGHTPRDACRVAVPSAMGLCYVPRPAVQ